MPPFAVTLSESVSSENCCIKDKVISFSDISAVNFIVGRKLLARSLIKHSTSFLLQSQGEKTSSM